MLTFSAVYVEGEINKSAEVEWVDWGNIDNALCEMSEDEIGKELLENC